MIHPGAQYVPAPVHPAAGQLLAPTRAYLVWQAGMLPEGTSLATYDVCWTRNGVSQIDSPADCPNQSAVAATHHVVDALQQDATYLWKVRARYEDDWTSDFTIPSAFSTDASLAGRWLFEAGADDSSGFGHTGVLQNGAAYAPGFLGKAVSFDGVDDRVTIPDAGDLDFGLGDFSISAWVYPQREGVAEALIGKRSADDGWELYRSVAGQVTFFSATCGNAVTGASLPKNEWRHVVATRTGGSVRIHVGGTLAGTGSCAEDFTNAAPVSFGWNGLEPAGEHFQGLLDEVTLHRAALSTSSIVNELCAAAALVGGQPLPDVCP